jgi:hypothetical protein
VTRILDAWDQSVIVIDDCQVPEDPGYGSDTFRGVPLSLNSSPTAKPVVCAFPATLSDQETGQGEERYTSAKGIRAPERSVNWPSAAISLSQDDRQPNTIRLLSWHPRELRAADRDCTRRHPASGEQAGQSIRMRQDAVSGYGSSYGPDRQPVAISRCGLTTIR